MPTAYIDTCVVSGLAKRDLVKLEIDAVTEIIRVWRSGQISLVTSAVTKREIDAIPEKYLAPHDDIYRELLKIPVAGRQLPVVGQTAWGGGAISDDPDALALSRLLPDVADVDHLLSAKASNVSYFVTTDDRTILRFAERIAEICKIDAVLPSRFVAKALS